MQFEALKYLYDMEQACVLLSSFLVGKTFADYEADPMLRSAVERQLMIVGEALNRLRKIEPELLASITDSRKIIAFRNILVHGYYPGTEEAHTNPTRQRGEYLRALAGASG